MRVLIALPFVSNNTIKLKLTEFEWQGNTVMLTIEILQKIAHFIYTLENHRCLGNQKYLQQKLLWLLQLVNYTKKMNLWHGKTIRCLGDFNPWGFPFCYYCMMYADLWILCSAPRALRKVNAFNFQASEDASNFGMAFESRKNFRPRFSTVLSQAGITITAYIYQTSQ